MNKPMYFFFYITLIIFTTQFSQLQADSKERIGVISLFQGPSGLFYNNRAVLIQKGKSRAVLFPQKLISFPNINRVITDGLINKLKHSQIAEFISLSPLDPAHHLSGYFIEGPWGLETKGVTIRGLLPLFKQHKLDRIIAIVPVTYYHPILKGEASGLNLTFSDQQLFFSATYAIQIYRNVKNFSSKNFSSIKQVFIKSIPMPTKTLKGHTYTEEHIQAYNHFLQENFLPHIYQQVESLIKKEEPSKIFKIPDKPHFYWTK